jgi:beta-lactam-binding protein with PASTA domain
VAFGDMYGLALSTVPPGYVAVPSVIGDTTAQASQALRAAGLFLRAVTTRIDPTCENIGTVMSQRPVGGSYAGRNTSVSVTIGKLPTRPCL